MDSEHSQFDDEMDVAAPIHQQSATSTAATAASPMLSDNNSNVIRPYGYTESDCGYCKGSRCHLVHKAPSAGSKSYSLLADSLSPAVYEGFMYRGWRRSGIHLYKPCNFESCCPTLTIRLASQDFQPTKSQKKLLRRMNHLVVGGESQKESSNKNTKKQSQKSSNDNKLEQLVQQSGILSTLQEITDRILLQVLPENVLTTLQNQNVEWKSQFRIRAPSKKDRKQGRIQATCDVCTRISGNVKMIVRDELISKVEQAVQNDAQFQSAAKNGSVSVIELEAHPPSGQIRCTLQLEDQEMSTDGVTPNNKTEKKNQNTLTQPSHDDKLADWYQRTTGRPMEAQYRRIEIETMTAHQSALNPEVHKLYAYYQNIVHNDPNPFLGERKNEEQGDNHEEASESAPTDPSQLDWGNAPMHFKEHIRLMLVNYLAPIPVKHRNVVLENFYSFYQFLVEAPFPFSARQEQVQPAHVWNVIPKNTDSNSSEASRITPGLYHQHYRLGDMLIAVGVVDILPTGLSSVYLFYHPTFSHELVALGKYAILQEIEFTRDILKCPYYYLGYYIESCQKMRYKAEYHPSELLCPKYYQWTDAVEAVKKLQQTPRHVCPLVKNPNEAESNNGKNDNEEALHHLYMDIGAGINVTIDMLQPSGVQVVKPILDDFVKEAGPELSVKCIVKLS